MPTPPPPVITTVPVPAAQFRMAIPAFANTQRYGDDIVNYYLYLAQFNVNKDRWGEMYNQGMMWWAAHFITLDAADAAAAARGAAAGAASGLLTSKSVGSVSMGYDMATASEPDAGHWNLTIYGKRYFAMLKMAGMGGLQIS